MRIPYFLLLPPLAVACGTMASKPEVAQGPGADRAVPAATVPEGTARMAALLAGLQAQLDSAPDAYQNSALADRMGAMMRTMPDRQQQAIMGLQRT